MLDEETIAKINALLPEGYSVESAVESGQPNGIGEIEPSWYREWYDDSRISHYRELGVIVGPWEPKP